MPLYICTRYPAASLYSYGIVKRVKMCLWQANKTGGYKARKQMKRAEKNIGRTEKSSGQRREKFRFHHPSKLSALPATKRKEELVVSGVYVSAAAIGLFTFAGDQRK